MIKFAFQKVHQMKLNREKLIHEEDGESEYGSTPTIQSRTNSIGKKPGMLPLKLTSGSVNVPEIVVEGEQMGTNNYNEDSMDGGEDTQMLSPTSPTERKPIYINKNKHSNPLMAAILQRKLQEMEGNNQQQQQKVEIENDSCSEIDGKGKSARTLKSAPNLAHHKVNVTHENLLPGQNKFSQ